ncbi:MAG: hypothetical protein JST75_11920 [Bacteroidetes bacterium]|nr:hypothetical protein [Bacteroidota bacterium]
MKTTHKSWSAFLLMIPLVAGIAGCNQQPPRDGGGGGTGSIPYNEDSVRSHIIKIEEARKYAAKYRTYDTGTNKQLDRRTGIGGLDFGRAEAFNRDAIIVLLNQKDSLGNPAAGVRVYYGVDEGDRVKLILVPYDSKGNDIIHTLVKESAVKIPGISNANAFWDGGQAIDNGQRCPTVCSSPPL